MMGPSHALSGAAVWLTGTWALQQYDIYHQSALEIAVGTAVCAGGAMFPDLDMSGKVTRNEGGATVARTFGVLSLFVAEVVEKISVGVYSATRGKEDPVRRNGHRTLTHTIPFTLLVGWGTTALCTAFGKWAVIGILFFTIGLALRGLFDNWAKRAGWVVITLVSAGGAYYAFLNLPAGRGYPMLGLAMGVGCFVHLMGDIITRAGIPILWPIPYRRKMWHMVGLPDPVAIKAGGTVETVVLRTVFTLLALLAGAAIVTPYVLERVGAWGL